MQVQWIKIDEVLFFQEGPGVRNTQYTSTGVKLLNVANLVNGKVDLSTSDRYISEEEAYGKYKHFLCDEGDFIVASSGIKVEYIDKKMGFIEKSMLPLCMNTSTIRFKVKNPDILRIRYFMYYLKSQHFKSQLARYITGSAQLNYGPSHLKKMVMPLASIDKQDEIVEKLDCLQNAINIREQQLAKLDELVKSRFVEMFGHQSHNEKSLPYLTIDDVAEIYLGITHTPTYVDSGVMFISAKNTSGDFLDLSDVKYISREEFEGAPKGSKPQVNDVLFSRVGSNLGHPVILEEDLELCTFVSLGFLRTKGKVTSNYLKHWMRDEFFATQVSAHVKGGGQPNLNTGWLKEFKIIVPSTEAQKEFDEFCKQVDKSKFAVQQSLEKLETLKKSLMQQYFG